ncbi:MAG: sugar phosphate isomerase/epimerase family protein [SAR202 cluster bacterium]|jgi:sugar phosphate isomerase/epimerase|nr:sugar phosphate isomerase/epimerase family protein [SAR202 cluster bacterium]
MTDNSQSDSSFDWTAEEIEARLGSSTIPFPRDRLLRAEDIEKLRKIGITRIEVCGLGNPGHLGVDDRKYLSWVRSECEKQGVSVVSTHSPGYLYNSDDEDNRKRAVEEGVHAAKVSEELGAGVMVCHFKPEEPSEKSVNEMLDQLKSHSIKLAIENGQDLADYTAFIDKVGSDQFGMVVDIGHTRDKDGVNPFIKKDRARETMAQCGDRLIHLHLHDWVDQDHFSPLDGAIQWDEIFTAFRDIDYKGWFMFEAAYPPGQRGEVDPNYVLDKVGAFPRGFIERYGRRARKAI